MPEYLARVLTGATLIAATAHAYAQPNPNRPMAAQPADDAVGVPAAEVKQYIVARDDPRPDLRVFVWQPSGQAPAGGYPVIYMLDGDTVFESLTATAAAVPDSARPNAVIVGIGYDIDASLRQTARSYDYTPASPGADRPVGGPRDPNAIGQTLPGGGAQQFLDTLEHRIKPFIAHSYAIDPQDQTLYGHSYGGLFALHVLLTQPAAFERYAAASPSLWWNGRYMPEEVARPAAPVAGLPRQVTIMVGHDLAPPGRPDNTQGVAAILATRAGVVVHYTPFPDLSHAAMLPASIAATLHGR